MADQNPLRELPAVHEILGNLSPALERFPRGLVVREIRRAVDQARRQIRAGEADGPAIERRVEQALAALEQPSLLFRPLGNLRIEIVMERSAAS